MNAHAANPCTAGSAVRNAIRHHKAIGEFSHLAKRRYRPASAATSRSRIGENIRNNPEVTVIRLCSLVRCIRRSLARTHRADRPDRMKRTGSTEGPHWPQLWSTLALSDEEVTVIGYALPPSSRISQGRSRPALPNRLAASHEDAGDAGRARRLPHPSYSKTITAAPKLPHFCHSQDACL
jgi:hypothetical protein